MVLEDSATHNSPHSMTAQAARMCESLCMAVQEGRPDKDAAAGAAGGDAALRARAPQLTAQRADAQSAQGRAALAAHEQVQRCRQRCKHCGDAGGEGLLCAVARGAVGRFRPSTCITWQSNVFVITHSLTAVQL